MNNNNKHHSSLPLELDQECRFADVLSYDNKNSIHCLQRIHYHMAICLVGYLGNSYIIAHLCGAAFSLRFVFSTCKFILMLLYFIFNQAGKNSNKKFQSEYFMT